MSVRPYYSAGGASAAFYDVVTAADGALRGDVELYASLLRPGCSVLELGAGTGRIAMALARRGFDVTGLEIAPAMLELALGLQPAGLRLDYVLGDMRTFDLHRRFDAVLCPFYALAHLPAAEWQGVFRRVVAHLAPDGLAAFHMPVAERLAEPAPPEGARLFEYPALGLTLLMGGKSFDPLTGRFAVDLDYVTDAGSSRERLTLFAGDVAEAAALAGLTSLRAPIPLGSMGLVSVFSLGRN